MGFYYFRDTSPLLNGGEQDGNKQKKMIDRWTGQSGIVSFRTIFLFFFFFFRFIKIIILDRYKLLLLSREYRLNFL